MIEKKQPFLKNISKNVNVVALFNILSLVILNGVNFISLPFFTKVLGPDNYGVVTMYATRMAIFNLLIGLQSQGTIGAAFMHFEEEEKEKYVSSVLSLTLCVLLLFSAVFFSFSSQVSFFLKIEIMLLPIILLQSYSSFIISFTNNVYAFRKEGYKNFFISIITSASCLTLTYLLLYRYPIESKLYMGKILGDAIPLIFIGFALVMIFLFRGKTFINKKYWWFCLTMCLPLIPNGFSHILLAQGGKIVLERMEGVYELGIYSLAATFSQLLMVVSGAFNVTWMPIYFELIKENEKNAILERVKDYVLLYSMITVGFLLVFPEIFKVFADSSFYSAVSVIPLLVLGSYFSFLYGIPANFEFYHRKSKMIAVATTISGISNIGLSFILIKMMGSIGAAIAMLVSYIFLFLLHQRNARSIEEGTYPFSNIYFLKYIVIVLLGIITQYVFSEFTVIRWTLAVVLGLAISFRIIKNKRIF